MGIDALSENTTHHAAPNATSGSQAGTAESVATAHSARSLSNAERGSKSWKDFESRVRVWGAGAFPYLAFIARGHPAL